MGTEIIKISVVGGTLAKGCPQIFYLYFRMAYLIADRFGMDIGIFIDDHFLNHPGFFLDNGLFGAFRNFKSFLLEGVQVCVSDRPVNWAPLHMDSCFPQFYLFFNWGGGHVASDPYAALFNLSFANCYFFLYNRNSFMIDIFVKVAMLNLNI